MSHVLRPRQVLVVVDVVTVVRRLVGGVVLLDVNRHGVHVDGVYDYGVVVIEYFVEVRLLGKCAMSDLVGGIHRKQQQHRKTYYATCKQFSLFHLLICSDGFDVGVPMEKQQEKDAAMVLQIP